MPRNSKTRRTILSLLCGCAAAWTTFAAAPAQASDHLDSPTVIADPRADIGDLFAWTAPDGRRLNLVMTIVGHSFSDKLDYVFHIDSGRRFGATTATIDIVCRFPDAHTTDCRLGDVDRARGEADRPDGLASEHGRFRVFAGLRDDPFFNNVRGTRDAYAVADRARKAGAVTDAAGCTRFDRQTVAAIQDAWRHTDGGPAKNFLAGWTPASIVVSVDLAAVNKGGDLLAVWSATVSPERQVDRAARPLTGNALLGTLASEAESNALKEAYNAATPAQGTRFVAPLEEGVALYDSFAGGCGDGLLAAPAAGASRYLPMALVLADDRLWVNSASRVCTQFFAVELAALAGRRQYAGDCGGRTPNYSAVNVYRSLLADGTTSSLDDGLEHDEKVHSTSEFPFLAPPDAAEGGAR